MEADEPTAAVSETLRRQDDAEMFEVQQLRVMEQPNWTEGRLDDLNQKVDQGIGRLDEERKELRTEVKGGFDKVDNEFKAVRKEMKEGFEKVDEEFKAVRTEMKEGFEKVDGRFETIEGDLKGLHRVIVYGVATMSGTMVLGFATLAAQL